MNEIRPKKPAASSSTRFDDEIDLIDLAITLWRRKWIVLGVATVVFAFAALYVLQNSSSDEARTVSTIIEVPSVTVTGDASRASVELISVDSLREIIKRVFIPEHGNSDVIRSDTTFETPKGTNLLVVQNVTTKSLLPDVVDFHKELADRTKAILAERRENLNKSEPSANNGVIVYGGGIVDLARVTRGTKGTAPSTTVVLALGAILGLFAGLFAALMVGFVSAARERLHETESTED